jgi:hypothetical protein
VDDELARMFEAHVRYEVGRWSGDALRETVAEEVAACFDQLDDVRLEDLVPRQVAQDWARRIVIEEAIPDSLLDEIDAGIRAGWESLGGATARLDEIVPEAGYEQLVDSVVVLQRLRREAIDQVTESAVYAKLIAHVLYHGLKDYLLTENAVVRRVPGASSLLRMGQNAMRSATPNLENGIDRRLVAFVAANVGGTVRDSREFLDETLDETMMRTIADEVWAVNRSRTIGEFADLVDGDALDGVSVAAGDLWLAVRSSPLVGKLVDAVVEVFYDRRGDESVAALLSDLGVTRERAGEALGEVAAQLAPVVREGGHLESYVRRRLEAFYATYSPTQVDAD